MVTRYQWKKEAGGYIVGYQHYETENITLEQISHPYRLDIRKSTFFSMRDQGINF